MLKACRLLSLLRLNAADVVALGDLPRGSDRRFDFDAIPVAETDPDLRLDDIKTLIQASITQSDMPKSDTRLLEIIATATDSVTARDELERTTGWGRSLSRGEGGADMLRSVALELGLAADSTAAWQTPDTYARLQAATRWLQARRWVIEPDDNTLRALLDAAGAPSPSSDQLAVLRALARSRFASDADWYKALTSAMDRIRARQRDALLAWVLYHNDHGWAKPDEVYEFLLIDVQMGPCQLSSRIVQAHAAIQLFVQRCLMHLEPAVALGDVSNIAEWREWEWMKNYRVWEAARKIFLYPENWIEPDLRDVKSPFFEDLENELLQDEIKPETVERAVRSYLTKLHEVARLDIRALYEETIEETGADGETIERKIIHMVGRTRAEPHVYYYRQRLDTLEWTPWEKLELSIDADHLVLAVQNRRPMLFWPQWQEVQIDRNDPPSTAWDMGLNWSVREFGQWSAPNRSRDAVRLPIDARQTVTLRPMVTEDRINILVYLFVAHSFGAEESRLGVGLGVTAFAADTCGGAMFATVLPTARLRLLPPL